MSNKNNWCPCFSSKKGKPHPPHCLAKPSFVKETWGLNSPEPSFTKEIIDEYCKSDEAKFHLCPVYTVFLRHQNPTYQSKAEVQEVMKENVFINDSVRWKCPYLDRIKCRATLDPEGEDLGRERIYDKYCLTPNADFRSCDRLRGYQNLLKSSKYQQAIEILEKLHTEHPENKEYLEYLEVYKKRLRELKKSC